MKFGKHSNQINQINGEIKDEIRQFKFKICGLMDFLNSYYKWNPKLAKIGFN